MINREYKFVFIHMVKNAGNSVASLFCPDIPKRHNPLLKNNINKKKINDEFYCKRNNQHLTVNIYLNYINKIGDNPKDYKFFTIIRNPYERVVSYFLYRKRRGFNLPSCTFKSYCQQQAYFFPRMTYDWYVGKHKLDYIIRFENLQNDWANMCNKFNWNFPSLPHTNKALSLTRKHYSAYYDEQTKNMIDIIFKDDIEKFGYQFKNLS